MSTRRRRTGPAPWWVLWLAGHKKAVVGTVTAGLTTLGTAIADGDVSGAEVVLVLVAMLGTGGVVNQVVNTGPMANATEVPLEPTP